MSHRGTSSGICTPSSRQLCSSRPNAHARSRDPGSRACTDRGTRAWGLSSSLSRSDDSSWRMRASSFFDSAVSRCRSRAPRTSLPRRRPARASRPQGRRQDARWSGPPTSHVRMAGDAREHDEAIAANGCSSFAIPPRRRVWMRPSTREPACGVLTYGPSHSRRTDEYRESNPSFQCRWVGLLLLRFSHIVTCNEVRRRWHRVDVNGVSLPGSGEASSERTGSRRTALRSRAARSPPLRPIVAGSSKAEQGTCSGCRGYWA